MPSPYSESAMCILPRMREKPKKPKFCETQCIHIHINRHYYRASAFIFTYIHTLFQRNILSKRLRRRRHTLSLCMHTESVVRAKHTSRRLNDGWTHSALLQIRQILLHAPQICFNSHRIYIYF